MNEAGRYLFPLTAPSGKLRAVALQRDEWTACRDRAGAILQAPGLLLPLLFGIAFGVGYAVIAEETAGWALAGTLVALLLVAVGADNIKFWVVLYPLIFLAPRFMLGAWSESGEKLFGLQLYEPWILLLLCLWIPRMLAAKRLKLPWSMKGPLGALFVLGLLAIWIAPDRMLALKIGGRTFFEPLLLFVLITSLSWTRTELRWTVLVLLSVATVVSVASLLGYSTGASLSAHGLTRLQSYWEGSNVLAAFLGTTMVVGFGWLCSVSSRTSFLTGLVAFLTMATALILTYTRGAWIALGVGFIVMISQLRAWLWSSLAALLIIAAVLIGPPELLHRAQSIVHFETDPSASNRLDLWPKVIELIADRPLTGYGFGGFQVLFRDRADIQSIHAHNLFLDLAMSMGVPALILFLWIVSYVMAAAYRTIRRFRWSEEMSLMLGVWAGSLSLLVAGFIDGSVSVWPILAHTFWFILALTYALTIAGGLGRDLRLSQRPARHARGPAS